MARVLAWWPDLAFSGTVRRVCQAAPVGCPAEVDGIAFGNAEFLSQTHVQAEVAGSAQVVAVSGLAGIGQAERIKGIRAIAEDVREACRGGAGGAAVELSGLRLWPDQHAIP